MFKLFKFLLKAVLAVIIWLLGICIGTYVGITIYNGGDTDITDLKIRKAIHRWTSDQG